MKITELQTAYRGNRIEKKLYWSLMREKTAVLKELQDLIVLNENVRKVEIIKDGIILERRDGIKIYFDFSQTICRAEVIMYLNGNPEEEDLSFISEVLPPQAVCLDIGANIGLISTILKKQHQDAKFYAFEPIPSTFEKMKKNIDLNNVEVTLFNIGFSDKCESVEFYLPGTDEAASIQPLTDSFYLKKSTATGEITGEDVMQKVLCTVKKIDTFVEENNLERIDFIKIDTEGNEKFVFQGATQTLLKYQPLIYCELLRKHCARFNYSPNEVLQFMASLNYSCFILENKKLVKFNKMDENTIATNFFFLHNERHLDLINQYMS